MIIVPEEACPGLLSLDDAFVAVEQVFAAMARGDAYNFPVVREAIGHADALYGFKGGFDREGVDGEFFPDGRTKSNFLINLGYGLPEKLHPRQPRFAFEEFCTLL